MLKIGEKGVVPQRDKKTYAVVPHVPCGVITPGQLSKIADVSEKYKAGVLKLTSAARIAIVGVEGDMIDQIWDELGMVKGKAVGKCVRSIKACPGNSYCKLGFQDALAMGMKLDEKYHGLELPNKTKMGVSGCNNQCAENCIKDVSLVGRKKGWTLMAGGIGTGKPRLADIIAENLSDGEAEHMIEVIFDYYKDHGKSTERIGKMIDRIGFDSFRNDILQKTGMTE